MMKLAVLCGVVVLGVLGMTGALLTRPDNSWHQAYEFSVVMLLTLLTIAAVDKI